jgi:predicted nucleic acid-binding protein
MCIIIDTNTFSSVFDRTSSNHDEFLPVLNWVIEGEGKIVFGGTKYRNELKVAYKYLKLIGQLNRSRKVVQVNDPEIDAYQTILEAKENHKDFDDPHIVAISYVSKCKLICSLDKRAYPFFSRKDFYPNNSPRPSIYSSKKNANLLCRKYTAEICLPCVKLNKEDIAVLKK